MTRTPKEAFLQSEFRGKHEEMVLTQAFQVACDYALLVFVSNLPPATDPSKGWDTASQITGAKEVLEVLKSLHEPAKTPAQTKFPSLKYNQ